MNSESNYLSHLYYNIKEKVVEAGFENEIKWQKNIISASFTEEIFLREAAWVILCSGFKEVYVRKIFGKISLCFCDWDSAEEIVNQQENIISCALHVFKNKKKLDAIVNISKEVHKNGFLMFKKRIEEDPINKLQELPFIGPVTSFHLAKNIGLNVAKPDRHLLKITEILGYSNVQMLCKDIERETREPMAVVDLVLWRYATIFRNYLSQIETLKKRCLSRSYLL